MADQGKLKKVKGVDFSGAVRRPTPDEVEHAFAGLGEEMRTFNLRMTQAIEAFKNGITEVLRTYDNAMREAQVRAASGGTLVEGSTTFPNDVREEGVPE